MRSERKTLHCSACGKEFSARVILQVDLRRPEDQTADLKNGDLFTFRCPHCGTKAMYNHYLLWFGAEASVAVCNLTCSEERRALEEAIRTTVQLGQANRITLRIVKDPAVFVEKTEIFSSGLDDRAVEIVKLYFAGEAHAAYPEKEIRSVLFFRSGTDYGFLFRCADGDLTVTVTPEQFQNAAAQFSFSGSGPEVVDAAWAVGYLKERRPC